MTKMFAKSILAVTPLPPAPPPSLSLRACAFALLRYKRALLMTARYGRAHGYLGADKVWGLYEDSFSFSGCSTTGLMGQTCAQMPPPDGPIPAGARTLRSANGTVVGEGVCCNSVIDSVVSAVRIGCDPPPPAPPPGTVGTFHLSRLQSAVELHGVSNVTLSGLEIR